jgi:hypothetical protein
MPLYRMLRGSQLIFIKYYSDKKAPTASGATTQETQLRPLWQTLYSNRKVNRMLT